MSLSYIFLKYIIPIISPTYLITVLIKNEKASKIIKINIFYFYISFFFTISLYFLPSLFEKRPSLVKFIFFLFVYYCISRIIEIFLVYLIDSIEKMKYKSKPNNGLSYCDKFLLALRNYLELIFTYGTIYFSLNSNYLLSDLQKINFFNDKFQTIYEALYFSANTITLLGYGDIYPTHILSQFFSIFQLLSGVYILIVTFSLYVNLNFTNPNYLKSKSNIIKKQRQKSLIIIQILAIILLIIGGTIVFDILPARL